MATFIARYVRDLLGNFRRPRFWLFLMMIVLLGLVGRLLHNVDVLQPLRNANALAIEALYALDPFVIGSTFERQMEMCRYSSRTSEVTCVPRSIAKPIYLKPFRWNPADFRIESPGSNARLKSPVDVQRLESDLQEYRKLQTDLLQLKDSYSPYGYFRRALAAVTYTAIAVWEQGWLTRTVAGIAIGLAAAFLVLVGGAMSTDPQWVKSAKDRWAAFVFSFLLSWIWFLGLIGVIAFFLKYSLLLLTLAFDAVLGLAIWLAGLIGWVWWSINVIKNAEKFESGGMQLWAWWKKPPTAPPPSAS